MLDTKELLLYAQREALHFWYADTDYSLLEDSNRPYDWDHIFPKNWIHKKQKINSDLKEWYNTIGNFRAWPYALNRSDQDCTLDKKFDQSVEEILEKIFLWFNVDKNNNELEGDFLCRWSACEKGWKKIKYPSMKQEKDAKKTIKHIKERSISIYKIWYDNLLIGSLI